MTRNVSTTEALMTDPTTEEGRAYWRERHDYEAALEIITDDLEALEELEREP